MVWNPADFGGIEKIVVRAEDVWTPDILLYNRQLKYRPDTLLGSRIALGMNSCPYPPYQIMTSIIFSESEEFDAKYRSNIQFTYNGEALWVPPSLQKSACEGHVRINERYEH